MQTLTHFQALDHISLVQIFSYLNTSDVLQLNLTCKDFYKIISTSPYILRSLFENLFGRNIPIKAISNLTFYRFQEILKSHNNPLPFFGFRGNCGCEENNPKFLFDKIFEFSGDKSVVCTKPGENFDIEGILSEDYAREANHIKDIITALNQSNLMLNSNSYSLKGMLLKYGSGAVDMFPPNPDSLVEEKIQSLRDFRQESSHYLREQRDRYNIELPCQKMVNSVGLIQSCHLKREIERLTCPVKTLVVFASLNEEIRSSLLASLFNDCKTSDDLLQLLKDHKNYLPEISQTSIKKLAELFPNIKYIDEEKDGVEFVVFNSNGKKQDVIPLFWVNFNKAIDKDLFLDFKDNSFSGRYVMVKLIQCEDLRMGAFLPNHPKNIDMNFCCFYGVIDV